MRISRRIRSGGRYFTIEFNRIPDGSNRYAETDFVTLQINIGSLTTPEHGPTTLMHELLHTISQDRHIKMTEDEIDNLANGLTQVLQDLGCWPETFSAEDLV